MLLFGVWTHLLCTVQLHHGIPHFPSKDPKQNTPQNSWCHIAETVRKKSPHFKLLIKIKIKQTTLKTQVVKPQKQFEGLGLALLTNEV